MSISATPTRVVLYSHDSQGLGHVRRNLAIAHHLARLLPQATGRPIAGLLVTGLPDASAFPLPPGFDWLALPGITKDDSGYRSRHLGTATRELIRLRSDVLEATLLAFAPDLVIVDRHVHGVDGELRRPLRRLREQRPDTRVVLGLREVLDSREVAAAEWRRIGSPMRLRQIVDEVWIYGDPRVHDPVATGEVPGALADRVRYTGYLAHGRADAGLDGALDADRPFVLTTAGGGSDGAALLLAAAAARLPEGHQHLVVTGPQIDAAQFEQIAAAARPGTVVRRALNGLSQHIEVAAAVISMGGYNTVCEILATDTPALIVPREVPRREQLIRAGSLAAVGAVDTIRADAASPDALTAWLATTVDRRVDRSALSLHGLSVTATLAGHLLARRRRTVAAPAYRAPAFLKGVGA